NSPVASNANSQLAELLATGAYSTLAESLRNGQDLNAGLNPLTQYLLSMQQLAMQKQTHEQLISDNLLNYKAVLAGLGLDATLQAERSSSNNSQIDGRSLSPTLSQLSRADSHQSTLDSAEYQHQQLQQQIRNDRQSGLNGVSS